MKSRVITVTWLALLKNMMRVLNISCDGGCYLKHRQLELQVEFLHFRPACLNAA